MSETKKDTSIKFVQCVASCSIALNLFLALNLYLGSSGKVINNQLSWSRLAAEEAELAASMDCSGHGRAYLDGFPIDGKPVCECNLCYGGPDCSEFSPDCPANASGGDPLFLEQFWREHAADSGILVAGWHRMSYSFSDQTYISQQLDAHIRKLHNVVGNAVTDGKFLVFGAGSTQLLYAAVHALSLPPDNTSSSSSPAQVVASIPYYALYEMQTDFFDSRESNFQGDAAILINNSDVTTNIIEFVTSPNNPDGQLNKPLLKGSNVKTIYDRAYFWPHFTAIPNPPAHEDLTIFTISKLTGHAGSRFGWALIKDERVYERMTRYMQLNSMGVSRDTQLRALKLLKVVLDGGGREIFKFGYEKMKKRWERLTNTLSLSNRFSLQKVSSQDCAFFRTPREPTPAYAWVKCEREDDEDCFEVMKSANIIGRAGAVFRADNHYVRLSLIRGDDDFDILINNLHKLVSEEGGVSETM
ncbi:tryptophan aminotransferase-related protein 4-like isoform X2 [Punica granatum]|uniref:Tryptophan aminotransferase-related protein 4-like isoform X2 n=2 Tax=Punica granatum TaxID=22663 RepID=A0A6P8D2R2_PUNGR|nr:tryptophan aminotransferase-related protein 4-like isoform X2 [Punica granatum]PKI62367.1 hypothetical protein CRG98_017173 [Punica granatum]